MTSAEEPQKLSGLSWATGVKNALNIRTSFRRAPVVSTGNFETERAEWSIDLDVPTGVSVDELEDNMETYLDSRATKWRAKITATSETRPVQPSPTTNIATNTKPVGSPSKSPPKHVTESESFNNLTSQQELEQFSKTLKRMPSKPDGSWAFTDKPESAKIVAVLRQRTDRTIVLGSFRYTLSKDGKFVNRWPHHQESTQ